MIFYLKEVLVSILIIFFIFADIADSYVYIYKIKTDNKTFITASKLSFNAFVMYNGGVDLIKEIKILDIYDDKDFNKAIEDYDLEPANFREIPFEGHSDNRTNFNPFIWWR
ncbi:MAG: hypothetical protein SVN78_06485 [Deferribacterota bacterium]|nr:hypothetical protein [Deferribacterota bacterium]